MHLELSRNIPSIPGYLIFRDKGTDMDTPGAIPGYPKYLRILSTVYRIFFKPNLISDSNVSYEIKTLENILSTEIIVQRKKREQTYTVSMRIHMSVLKL